jgi:hypothetical protein
VLQNANVVVAVVVVGVVGVLVVGVVVVVVGVVVVGVVVGVVVVGVVVVEVKQSEVFANLALSKFTCTDEPRTVNLIDIALPKKGLPAAIEKLKDKFPVERRSLEATKTVLSAIADA